MEALNSRGYTVKSFDAFRAGPETVAWMLPSYYGTAMMEGGREQAVVILSEHIDLLASQPGNWGREEAYVYHIGGGKHRIVATVSVDFETREVTWAWYSQAEADKAEIEWMFG